MNKIRLLILLAMFLGTTAPVFSQYFVRYETTKTRNTNPRHLTVFKDRIYFFADNDSMNSVLYYTDGSSTTPTAVLDSQGNYLFVNKIFGIGDNLLFMEAKAQHVSSGGGLWVTDGSPQGTHLVKEINTQPYPNGSTDIFEVFSFNGKCYFGADDGLSGHELWVTDGSESGTQLLKDINPGSASALPTHFFVLSGKLLFIADNGTVGHELWTTDGTSVGTKLLKDINPNGSAFGAVFAVAEMGGKAYFSANDSIHGEELWYTDGTVAGTQMLLDLNPGSASGVDLMPGKIAAIDDHIYFVANKPEYSYEIWKTDGTASGTVLLKDIVPSFTLSGFPDDLYVYNQHLYFLSKQMPNFLDPYLLWLSDGTEEGTQLLLPQDSLTNPDAFYTYKGQLYFSAKNAQGDQVLFQSDGSPENTTWHQPSWYTGSYGIGIPPGFAGLNNKLFYKARYLTYEELWSFGDTITTSIETPQSSQLLKMYPNPVKDEITIDYSSEIRGELQIMVYATDGRQVHNQIIQSSHGSNIKSLRLPALLPNGIYIMRLSGQGYNYYGKVAIVR